MGKYCRFTGRAFTTLRFIITSGVIPVDGGICEGHRLNTPENGFVTYDVLIDMDEGSVLQVRILFSFS